MVCKRSAALRAQLVIYGLILATGCQPPWDDEDDEDDADGQHETDNDDDDQEPSASSTTEPVSTGADSEGGSSADPSDGDTAETTGNDGDEEGSSGEATGGVEAATLFGHVSRARTAPLATDNDGIGTLYVGVFDGCAPEAALVSFAVVQQADVSVLDNVVDFEIADLAAGEYNVQMFLDDNEDAQFPDAQPGPGDIVADPDPEDDGQSCNLVTISGEDIDVDFALTDTI